MSKVGDSYEFCIKILEDLLDENPTAQGFTFDQIKDFVGRWIEKQTFKVEYSVDVLTDNIVEIIALERRKEAYLASLSSPFGGKAS